MYEQFFGLTERPFSLTSNPRYLLMTPGHREAMSNLEYGIATRNGITVVLGEAGTGKTTLLRLLMARGVPVDGTHRRVDAVYVSNPTLEPREFHEHLARGFNLSPQAFGSKTTLLVELERFLVERRRARTPVAVVVDEAQSLPVPLLEEIRLLANIESDTEKLLPLVLVGQPELADRLNERPLRQLKQRVALRCSLKPLDVQETAAYIAHRLTLAGGEPRTVFSREAVLAVHEASRGIARTVNVICENAMLTAFALDRRPVDTDLIAEVCAEFDLGASRVLPEPTPAETEKAAGLPAATVEGPGRTPLFQGWAGLRRSG